jgi:hypothetical protein
MALKRGAILTMFLLALKRGVLVTMLVRATGRDEDLRDWCGEAR